MTHRRRSGLAMLMVLAVLVLSTSAAVAILRVGIGDQLGKAQHRESAIAAELLIATEPAVLDWLAREAERTVLPPDAALPCVLVVDNELDLGQVNARVQITAWDQAGMIAPQLVTSEPAFAGCLPPDVQARIADVPERGTGLDTVPSRHGRRVFPNLHDKSPAVGALVATHNPLLTGERRDPLPAVINVNTAPLPLIETALEAAGLTAIGPIREARAEGRRASLAGIRVGEQAGYRLVGTSSVWAVRVDATVGHTRRSWWTIYANTDGQWRKVQRLVIDE